MTTRERIEKASEGLLEGTYLKPVIQDIAEFAFHQTETGRVFCLRRAAQVLSRFRMQEPDSEDLKEFNERLEASIEQAIDKCLGASSHLLSE